jgi:hypothetical protein
VKGKKRKEGEEFTGNVIWRGKMESGRKNTK